MEAHRTPATTPVEPSGARGSAEGGEVSSGSAGDGSDEAALSHVVEVVVASMEVDPTVDGGEVIPSPSPAGDALATVLEEDAESSPPVAEEMNEEAVAGDERLSVVEAGETAETGVLAAEEGEEAVREGVSATQAEEAAVTGVLAAEEAEEAGREGISATEAEETAEAGVLAAEEAEEAGREGVSATEAEEAAETGVLSAEEVAEEAVAGALPASMAVSEMTVLCLQKPCHNL